MRTLNIDELSHKVYEIVGEIPQGSVLTYGLIAALCGRPQNSRLVGKIMSKAPRDLTSHRVVNHMGRTVPGWDRQREYLENEGVSFKKNGCVDLKKHLWRREESRMNFDPVYDDDSKILILGTIPSPKSIENGFYYGHPQNSFWRVMAAVLQADVPKTTGEKICFLLNNNIALWDVLQSCKIKGASDCSIKEPVINDFSEILKSDIKAVFTTGRVATTLYNKHVYEKVGIKARYLPSTSPANRIGFDKLVREYMAILEYQSP